MAGLAGVYTQEEEDLLNLVKNNRLNIINTMTKDGKVPEKVGEIRVLNEVLNSIDSSVHTGVANRVKFQAAGDNQSALEIVAETLKAIGRQQMNRPVLEAQLTELPQEYIPLDTVYGEAEINPERLEIADFIEGDTKE
jgi:hypothetical protein